MKHSQYLHLQLCYPIQVDIHKDNVGELLLSVVFLVEVAVGEDQRGHQGPHVQRDADPAGGDLHPHRGPFAGHGLIVGVGALKINTGRNQIRDQNLMSQYYGKETVKATHLYQLVSVIMMYNEARNSIKWKKE